MQRLKLLGGISIETDAGPLTGRAVQRRRLALLALLAAARPRGASRDRLIALLWPEADGENGRHFLSDSVYRINQALGGDVILAAGDEVRLDDQRLPSDLAELEDALARGAHEQVVRICAGPFLDGFHLPDAPEFEHWMERERDRITRECASALEALAERAERDGDRAVAVTWWRRLATHDPYNSRVALRLMQALDAAGERAAAIQHARIHQTLLERELEVGPDPAVQELTTRLVSGAPAARGPADHTSSAGRRAAASASPSAPVTPPDQAASPPHPPSRRRAGSRIIAVVLGAVLLALVLGWYWLAGGRGRSASDGAASPMRDIAVLPFANLSADSASEYFSDGMTEELIATLGQAGGLRVASRTSVFAYKDTPVDVREVGRRLGADAVVEGSVRKSGSTLRIAVQLVSTADGYNLWSEVYERELEDVFSIQQDIARSVLAHLTGRPARDEQVRLAERSTQDPEAYDLYLRGRFAWHQRTREGLRQAVDFFGQAVARAPDYARAYVGLADAYAVSAFYDYMRPRDAYPRAEAAARRALELDSALAAPHATMGYILTYYHLDWPRAEAEFERALAADPSYSTAHQWYGNLLTVAGRFDEAAQAFHDAQEADPLSLIANAALGWSFYLANEHDRALLQCRRTLALEENFELAHLWGGWALEELDRPREAREWIERAVRLSNGSTLTRLALAHVLARSPAGADSARAIVRDIEALGARGEYVPSYEIGKVHLALGERDLALRWLERAMQERSHSRALLRVDPQLAPLRGDRRFEAMVAAVGVGRGSAP